VTICEIRGAPSMRAGPQIPSGVTPFKCPCPRPSRGLRIRVPPLALAPGRGGPTAASKSFLGPRGGTHLLALISPMHREHSGHPRGENVERTGPTFHPPSPYRKIVRFRPSRFTVSSSVMVHFPPSLKLCKGNVFPRSPLLTYLPPPPGKLYWRKPPFGSLSTKTHERNFPFFSAGVFVVPGLALFCRPTYVKPYPSGGPLPIENV